MSYETFYHRLNIERVIKASNKENSPMNDKEAVNLLVDTFQKVFNLGIGNNYTEEILMKRLEEFENHVRDSFPECFDAYSQTKNILIDTFKEKYSGKKRDESHNEANSDINKSSDNSSAKESEEKKTTIGTATQSLSGFSGANANA